nr:hypothetical protein PZA14_26585 [Klebsiella pneumoniae]
MTILSNLSIDLTDFTGRILIVSDLYGHFELLLKGLSKLTQSGDEVVVITTGNLFDWGPSPVICLRQWFTKNLVTGKFIFSLW